MKVITYGAVGGVVPLAVLEFADANGIDPNERWNPALVAFVEGFRGNAVRDIYLEETATREPKKLFHLYHTERDGIVSESYFGMSGEGYVVEACVNEYDESAMNVTIRNADDGEVLEPMPEYEPVQGAPGLYRLKD